MEVKQGEAGGAPAFDAASSIPLRVVAGMPLASGLDPLGDLRGPQLVKPVALSVERKAAAAK